MSENTKIEWCDHSWSPWRGCTKVSAGCANCYAETLSKRNPKVLGEWGKGKPRVLAKNWNDPVKWDRRVDASLELADPMGMKLKPTTVFPSLCDWLDDEVPVEWLARFLKLIHDTPNLTWLLLTKRPELFGLRLGMVLGMRSQDSGVNRQWLNDWLLEERPPSNVWIGTSVEDQSNADRRIPALLKIPAVGRFLSLEPLLGPVDLTSVSPEHGDVFDALRGYAFHDVLDHVKQPGKLDWLIIGGESGHGARPCNVEWVRSLVKQGRQAGTATFVKQLGARPLVNWPMAGNDGSAGVVEVGKTVAFTDCSGAAAGTVKQFSHPKGGDPAEWPEDLRVREYPEGMR